MLIRNLFLIATFALSAMGATLGPAPGGCGTESRTLDTFIGQPPCTFGQVGPEPAYLTLQVISFDALDLSDDGFPATLLTADQIDVEPPSSANGVLRISSDGFVAKQHQYVIYQFVYLIDPDPPVIPGFDLEMVAFSPKAPGNATITADLCLGGGFFVGPAGCSGGSTFEQIKVFHNGGAVCDHCFDSIDFDPVSVLRVRLTLELKSGKDGTGDGTSDIQGIRTRAEAVPEPSAFLLAGVGLAALGLFRRLR